MTWSREIGYIMTKFNFDLSTKLKCASIMLPFGPSTHYNWTSSWYRQFFDFLNYVKHKNLSPIKVYHSKSILAPSDLRYVHTTLQVCCGADISITSLLQDTAASPHFKLKWIHLSCDTVRCSNIAWVCSAAKQRNCDVVRTTFIPLDSVTYILCYWQRCKRALYKEPERIPLYRENLD